MLPLDIGGLADVRDPQLTAEGDTVAYVVSTIDLAGNRYRSAIWIAAVDGETPPRQLTSGVHRDGRPRWSRDGTRLTFVSHRRDSGSELYVLPTAGGEARRVVEWPEEIEDVAWSPDGTRIAFVARLRDEAQYGPDDDADRPPRRITSFGGRVDGAGWTFDRPRQLFVVTAASGPEEAPAQLTSGAVDTGGMAWSRDGTALVYAAAVDADSWGRTRGQELWRIDAGGGEPTRLTDLGLHLDHPMWHPERDAVTFTTAAWTDMPRHGQAGVLDLDAGTTTIVTTALDRNCTSGLVSNGPVWHDDDVLVAMEDDGDIHLLQVACDGSGESHVVVGGERQVTGFHACGASVAYTATDVGRLPELYVRVGGDVERRLSDVNDAFHDTVPVLRAERFTATSPDGAAVTAWVVRPRHAHGGERLPTLLNIHGGPFSQYGSRWFDEFQVQAGAGYVVLACNPRGSSGRSEAWGRAIRGPGAQVDPGSGWGGVDADDVLAVVDEAVRRFDFIDPDRIGVLGGSYGGYLTSWLIGHTDRFAAACSERSLNNMTTFVHTSDIGTIFPATYIGASHLDAPEEYVRQSPVTYAAAISTPLLILHAEGDLRCPIEQAEDLFVRLRMLGADVELVRFPGSNHELSRSGSPRHRVERMEVILEFFDRHLRPERS